MVRFHGEVPALLDGVRVDRAVSMLADCSRSQAASLLDQGKVLVDGQLVGRSTPLRRGQQMQIEDSELVDALPGPDPTVDFGVRYVDDELVVVEKPAGLVVHPGAGHTDGTLVSGLLAKFPDLAELSRRGVCPPARPGIVQRLDVGTSGLLVVARTETAFASLVQQLSERSVERRYLSLVWGRVAENRGAVDAPIGRSSREPTRMTVTATGRPARTTYRVVQRFSDEPCTLLELSLQSGRTHQIRVHLAAIGHPVVGDGAYAKRKLSAKGRAPAPAVQRDASGGRHVPTGLAGGRVFLHAHRLGLRHPGDTTWRAWESPLPPDLAEILARLEPASTQD